MTTGKKKIFISWSKLQSRRVGAVLKHYLPEILDGVEIFMSDKDIGPGERSMKVLERELDDTSYGIAVVTEANQSEPWLNLEAGAVSKAVGKDYHGAPYVVPLLVDIPSTTQSTGSSTRPYRSFVLYNSQVPLHSALLNSYFRQAI